MRIHYRVITPDIFHQADVKSTANLAEAFNEARLYFRTQLGEELYKEAEFICLNINIFVGEQRVCERVCSLILLRGRNDFEALWARAMQVRQNILDYHERLQRAFDIVSKEIDAGMYRVHAKDEEKVRIKISNNTTQSTGGDEFIRLYNAESANQLELDFHKARLEYLAVCGTKSWDLPPLNLQISYFDDLYDVFDGLDIKKDHDFNELWEMVINRYSMDVMFSNKYFDNLDRQANERRELQERQELKE